VQPPFPIDEAFSARIQNADHAEVTTEWGQTEFAEPLLAQLQPILGHEAEPDPAFFIDSWTIGVTAASENYLHRHHESKPREVSHASELPSYIPSFTFVSFLNIEPTAPAVSSSPEKAIDRTKDLSGFVYQEEEVELDLTGPLTLQTASRLLGVAANSSREQIRTAYRRMAGRYHPDRQESAGQQHRKQASDRMAAINAAYHMLSTAALDPA
jgi:hypothetical protein